MRMELNDKESKITLYSFGLAFFISFIIGIIVGNPFGIALVRAFLASFVFAMVVFGVIYILKKYIPEIFEISRMGRGVEEDIPPEIQTEDETLSEGRGVKSDYIEVGNVRIPNEPELLAKAIEKVMKEDES